MVDPTLIAVEIQAGAESAVVEPSLPDPTTVAIPAARNWSMIAFLESASHGDVKSPPARLMLIAAML